MKKVTKKTVVLGLIAIALVGGGSVYAYTNNQSKQHLKTAQTEVEKQEGTLKVLNGKLEGYFDKKAPSYLVENVKETQLAELKEEAKKATTLKDTYAKVDRTSFDQEVAVVNGTMTRLDNTFKQQQATNKLFTGTAANGHKIIKDLPIADDLKKETVDQVKKSTEKATSDFEKTVQSLATEAENQVKQIDKAKQATAKVYKDKVLSIDTKLYETATTEVNKIKNAKAKKALTDQLAKVKVDMDKEAGEQPTKQQDGQVEVSADNKQNELKSNDSQKSNSANAETNQETQENVGGNQSDGGSVGAQTPTPEPNYPQDQTPPVSNGGNTPGVTPPVEPEKPTEPSEPKGPPAGTVGPFYSEDECWAYAESQGWSGFAVTIIDGAMYISQR